MPVSFSTQHSKRQAAPSNYVFDWCFYFVEHTGDPYVTFNNDPLPDGVRSTLIIREANDKYFGSYNCSVANDYGMDAAEIILRKESKMDGKRDQFSCSFF